MTREQVAAALERLQDPADRRLLFWLMTGKQPDQSADATKNGLR